jgi:hypothetical protein
VGTNDAEFLAKYFSPVFDIHDLQRIPNFNAVTRMLVSGVPTQAFSMATLPPLGTPNQQLAMALKQLSAAKFGRPRLRVETEIFDRLRTEEPPKPSFDRNPPSRPVTGNMPPVGPVKASGGSFLDEWLAKRQQAPPAAPLKPALRTSYQNPTLSDPNVGKSVKYKDQMPKNISSNEIEQEEVQRIAEQLKKNMQAGVAESALEVPQDLALKKQVNEDTIIIDQEGNMSFHQDK